MKKNLRQEPLLRVDLISLFPRYFDSPLGETILGRAIRRGLIECRTVDLRHFGEGKRRQVDDRPFGGGPGMVLMARPLSLAIDAARRPSSHVVHLSPQGAPLTPAIARRLSLESHLILVCGHYEGVDERVIRHKVDEEVSIGDYVLTNGCLAALVLLDALSRFIPGVLSEESLLGESFEEELFDGPHYTQPEVFEGEAIPPVLRSGNHALIKRWRRRQAVVKTAKRRPDLLAGYLTKCWDELPTPESKVKNLTLFVEDLDRATRFYRTVLKFRSRCLDPSRALISLGSSRILLIEGEPVPTELRIDLPTTSFNALLSPRAAAPLALALHHERQIELRDPDGHQWVIKEIECLTQLRSIENGKP